MYTINSNILSKTGYTGSQLKAATLKLNPKAAFKDYNAFAAAENKYGIDSLFILAHAIIESAWGGSYYAKTRNNLFGFNAIDSDPNQASSYSSQAAAIDYYASFLKKNYLTKGGSFYHGATPHGVFVDYSSSHDTEASSVVSIMNKLQSNIPKGDYKMNKGDLINLHNAIYGKRHKTPQSFIDSYNGKTIAQVLKEETSSEGYIKFAAKRDKAGI